MKVKILRGEDSNTCVWLIRYKKKLAATSVSAASLLLLFCRAVVRAYSCRGLYTR